MTLYYPPTTINSTNGAVSFSNSNGVTFGGNLEKASKAGFKFGCDSRVKVGHFDAATNIV